MNTFPIDKKALSKFGPNTLITGILLILLFLIGWPVTSLWLVGLYVGISLLFDGWALVAIS